jgi:hypothetical protein
VDSPTDRRSGSGNSDIRLNLQKIGQSRQAEDLSVEELVAQLRVETLTVAVPPGRTGLDLERFCSCIPVVLDDLVPADHMCRVIDAFVEMLVMSELGFERAQAAETGRHGYDPRDLLKLYLYDYLNQIPRSAPRGAWKLSAVGISS